MHAAAAHEQPSHWHCALAVWLIPPPGLPAPLLPPTPPIATMCAQMFLARVMSGDYGDFNPREWQVGGWAAVRLGLGLRVWCVVG